MSASSPTAGAGDVQHPSVFYFRAIISNIPKETPLTVLTNPLVPNPQLHSNVGQLLNEYGVGIVSYKMQVFKEAELNTKFGHIDYFLAPVGKPKKEVCKEADGENKEQKEGEEEKEEAPLTEATLLEQGKPLVTLFWKWMKEEVQGAIEIAVPGVQLTLVPGNDLETLVEFSHGQHRDGRRNSYAALPAIIALDDSAMVSACTDPLKLSCYLWSKITIMSHVTELKEEAAEQKEAVVEGEKTDSPATQGVRLQLKLGDIPMVDFTFLRAHLPTIWPKEAGSEQLHEFFKAKLGSLCDIVPL